MQIRQPIVAVLGHVDSGKTSLLDRIRGTGVQGREAGGITQHIGASFLPSDTIKEMCGPLYKKLEQSEHKVPGLLVIDTPGHEVFTNLRSRGGSAADIAILVVDVNRGFQPQTNESLKILQSRKVPFVIALNKCDQISGWRNSETKFISQAIKEQDASIQTDLDQKLYDVVGTLSILGYKSEAFYRIEDFKSEIAIVPISARSGVGIPELLSVLVGLTQQYLQKRLDQEEKEPRGIVLEVKDEVGLGQTANVILIDGTIKKENSIVVAKRDGVIVTKPKALLLPKPLDEMRDPRDKFKPVSQVDAAAGLKIASPDLEGVLPGSTLYVAKNDDEIEKFTKLIESEMQSMFIDTETNGIILKCDTIGSLEAIVEMLKRSQVPVAKADIGPVNRRDVIEAKAIKEKDRHLGIVLAFNVKVLPDAQEESEISHIKLFEDKLEKLEQTSNHPDLGPVGDGLISLMDQKLSKLDDRLYELSSKMLNSKIQTPEIKQEKEEIKQEIPKSIKETFNFEKPKETKIEPIAIPPTKSRQSFELTTLTNISRTEPKFPLFKKKEVVKEITQPKVEDKVEIIQSITAKPSLFENKPDLDKEVAKIAEHKALPEQKPKVSTIGDDFDDDTDDLDKIKGDIRRVLSKLDQSEVE